MQVDSNRNSDLLRSESPIVSLKGLACRLLNPRSIERGDGGFLSHSDLPLCDENVRLDVLLSAFGLDCAYVSMEEDCTDASFLERVMGGASCLPWTPTSPQGRGWVLLEIFGTERGPCALFVCETKPRTGWPQRGLS